MIPGCLVTGSALVASVLLVAAPAPFAQSTYSRAQGSILSAPSPVLTVGDGVNSHGHYNGSDETPFLQAVAALPVGGATFVGQGTYTFSSPVTVASADIEIRVAGATLLSSNDGVTGVFHVTGTGMRIEGLRFRDDMPVASHALVRVQAGAFRLRDCEFFGGSAGAQTPVFVDVALASVEEGELWIQDNAFHPDRGWTVVRVNEASNANLTGNRIGIETISAKVLYVFHCTNMRMGEITGNIFKALGDGDSPMEAAVFSENGETEGHHLVIANNVFHDLRAVRVIHLRGARFNVVSSNSIGAASASTTIQGNDFHNVGPAPAIRINGGVGHHVSGNFFSLSATTCVSVGVDEPSTDVSVLANHFMASGTLDEQPAVWVSNGDGHAVLGNSFRGFVSPAAVVLGVPPSAFEVSGNFEL